MKQFVALFSIIITGLMATADAAMSPIGNFNVTSPSVGGIYVAGQYLPCVYQVYTNVSSQTAVSVSINSSGISTPFNATISSADPNQASQSCGDNCNQYVVNYPIPATAVAGSYVITFTDSSTQTSVPISISIRTAASTTTTSGSAATGSGNLPALTGGVSSLTTSTLTNILLLLGVITGAAFTL